jgi:hypothetical protein
LVKHFLPKKSFWYNISFSIILGYRIPKPGSSRERVKQVHMPSLLWSGDDRKKGREFLHFIILNARRAREKSQMSLLGAPFANSVYLAVGQQC